MAKSRNCCKYKKWPDVDVKTCHNSWSCWKFATKDLHTFQSPLSTSQLPWDAAGLDILAPNIEATMAVPEGTLHCFPAPSYKYSILWKNVGRKWHFAILDQVSTIIDLTRKSLLAKTQVSMHVFFSVASAINNEKQNPGKLHQDKNANSIFISQLPIAHLTFLLIPSVAQLQWCRDDFDPSGRWIYHVYTNILSHYAQHISFQVKSSLAAYGIVMKS